ncbi:MAG: hypothetical protein HRT35_27595 [Algicola sp.]|nr:hypothetical protein [Algicola sp.]
MDAWQNPHLHLSADIKTASEVGQRHGKPVVLIVNAHNMFEQVLSFIRPIMVCG